nr:D-alanyl-D-alanine carboxypeptidase/D-alanyl-D-alanine-endopeptidase [Bdellovibrio sp. CKG001]
MFRQSIVSFFCALQLGSLAWASDYSAEVARSAQKYQISLSDLSALIVTADKAPKTLVDINSDQRMSLASVSKLITSVGVLGNFGAKERFETTVKLAGAVRGALYKGDFYLVGGGDPSFGVAGMMDLAAKIQQKKIRKIQGDLVVDESLFDQVRYDSRDYDRVDALHDARIGAMSFHWNSFKIVVRPGALGKNAKLQMIPANDYIKIVGHIKTVKGSANGVIAERRKLSSGQEVLFVKGTLGRGYTEYEFEKNVSSPAKWSGHALKYYLKQKGIQITGQVKLGQAPADAVTVASHSGRTIAELLADLNKESNNVVAEMLATQIAIKHRRRASVSEGVEIINQQLQAMNFPKGSFTFLNPAGLNHGNRTSSRNMLKILSSVVSDEKLRPVFMDSLPISGVDGTLKKRGLASKSIEWVKAKTGYMKNVITMVGRVKGSDGRIFNFSFMYNGSGSDRNVMRFYDELLVNVVEKELQAYGGS